MPPTTSIIVIGGGIVGLATAWRAMSRFPGASVAVLDKEPGVAMHQTGRNSGVIHSGIYYKPGSLKALNCRRGKAMLESFCAEHAVPFETCGKVIVATDERELPALDRIRERGIANGVACEQIGPERLREIEPHVRGVRALLVGETGIVNYAAVCRRLADLIVGAGGRVVLNARVTGLRQGPSSVVVESEGGAFEADLAVNCAGLHSDRIAAMGGQNVGSPKIVPFRGEYFAVKPHAWRLCRNLIYPVPDPNFPFLGVHFTRMMGERVGEHGGVECGPNAVLAFGREAYENTQVEPGDLFETLTYPAFWKIALKYWRTGAYEMYRSFNKRAFVDALRRLVPDIGENDIEPAPAGIRAQALARDGTLLDDFAIFDAPRVVHVCNAPSPAATSSLSIGETIADRLAARLT